MSTLGKVFSVLVVLVSLIWVLLAATVAQFNTNGTQAFEAEKKKFAKLEADVATALHDLQEHKDLVALEQVMTDSDLTVLQTRQSDVEKARSEVIEIAKRIKFQVEGVEATVASAEALKKQRAEEKMSENEGKAKAEAEVEQFKAKNTELTELLTGLREKFKSTLEENRSLVQRLQKAEKSKINAASFTR